MQSSKSPKKICLKDGIEAENTLDILSSILNIDIPEASRAMVIEHLTTASAMADIVYATPLDNDSFDPATVFTPEERQ